VSTRLAIAVGACLIVGGIATAALALRSDDDSQGGSSRGDSQGTVHRGDSQGTVPRGCDPQLARLRAPGCRTVFNDTGADPDAERLWADIECVTEGRHRVVDTGGDPAPTALAQPQGNEAYRRLTVIDGDDLYGERCELGNNEHRACCGPNPAVYREGQHRITFISFWLPAGFPLRPDAWQGLLQMKQTQPSAGGGGAPAISVGLEEGRWILARALAHAGAGRSVGPLCLRHRLLPPP
jgi:hypothetical protein